MNKKAIFLLAVGMFFSTNCVFGMEFGFLDEFDEVSEEKEVPVNNNLKIDPISLKNKLLSQFCIPYYGMRILNHMIEIDPPFSFEAKFPSEEGNKTKIVNFKAKNEDEKKEQMANLEENIKVMMKKFEYKLSVLKHESVAGEAEFMFATAFKLPVKKDVSVGKEEDVAELKKVLKLINKEKTLYLEKKKKKAEGDKKENLDDEIVFDEEGFGDDYLGDFDGKGFDDDFGDEGLFL